METGIYNPAAPSTQDLLVAKNSEKGEGLMSQDKPPLGSPKWSSSLKMVIGLVITGLILALLISFRYIIGPLILAFILIYLLHPLAAFLNTHSRLSWRASVNVIYFSLLIIVIGLSTLTGLAVLNQIQSLIKVIETFINNLPNLLQSLSGKIIYIGPFPINLTQFTDLGTIGTQVMNALQLIISRAGTLAGTFATATVTTIASFFFMMIISYFVLLDTGKVPDVLDYINIPGYSTDIQMMTSALARIWNAFLRGQLTIVIMVIFTYMILLSILGVRYAIALAILAGLARFVPYVGAYATYIIMFLVTFFQGGNYFNLMPIYYSLITIGLSVAVDQTYDNMVSPRIMGRSLGVHPAAVLVVAIIAANLIGLIGLILAAPVLATVMLVMRYIIRKMLDLDPWEGYKEELEPIGFHWVGKLFNIVIAWLKSIKWDKLINFINRKQRE
jgi:predicted PurR-regulated permease PerM